MTAAATVDAVALIREVDSLRRYVASRLYGYQTEIDNVIQEARVAVWRTAHRFDENRDARAWVFGIVARVVTHEVHLLGRRALTVELTEHDGETYPDGLDSMVSRSERNRWLRQVADAASEVEWAVMVELVRNDGDAQVVASALDMPVRTVRAARDRVRALIRAARAAFLLLDADMRPTAAACMPDTGGLCEAYAFLDEPAAVAARELGIAPGLFRTRRALVRRIDDLVESIASAETRRG